MSETELNNSVLYANGPVPADGFLTKKDTSDDIDFFKVNFKGKRQVSATAVGVDKTCGGFELTRADGDWSRRFDSFFGKPDVDTWTTPRDDTEYIGRTITNLNSFPVGCQSLISFAPADAVVVTPITLPDYGRTLDLQAPGSLPLEQPFSFTATGRAADDDQVVAWLVDGGCGASPSTTTDPGSAYRTAGPALAFGTFTQSLTISAAPSTYAQRQLCVWLVDGLNKLATLQRQATVQFGDPPPPPAPPAPVTASTATTVKYAKRRYSGRVTSANIACYRGIRVELRRKGKGSRSYGSTVTRQDGTWTVRRARVKGKIFAFVPAQTSRGVSCLSSQSAALPKRH